MVKSKKGLLEFTVRAAFICLCSFVAIVAKAQNVLTLEVCLELSRRNFPLVKQLDLIEKSKNFQQQSINKNYIPQVNMGGQITYQSDVTNLPFSLPNVNVDKLSQDQYKIFAEVTQGLTELFYTHKHAEVAETNANVEKQKTEAELYKLRERVEQLYFGILLLESQIEQTRLFKVDVQAGIDKAVSAVANGAATQTNIDILQAELLKVEQRFVELKANKRTFTDMLSLMIKREINDGTEFKEPDDVDISSLEIDRPELRLFDYQKKAAVIQDELLTSKILPKFYLFFQGGYGKPALNFLKNEFELYYVAGIRLSWNLSAFFSFPDEKNVLSENQNLAEVGKETFLYNLNLQLKQEKTNVEKFEEMLSIDKDIVSRMESIKNTAKEQLAEGTITANDYILHANSEDRARQALKMHELQLLYSKYKVLTNTGRKNK